MVCVWCTVQNGWTDRDAVWGADSCGPKEQCIRQRSRSDESIRSRELWQIGDAAFCQITLDTILACYTQWRQNRVPHRLKYTLPSSYQAVSQSACLSVHNYARAGRKWSFTGRAGAHRAVISLSTEEVDDENLHQRQCSLLSPVFPFRPPSIHLLQDRVLHLGCMRPRGVRGIRPHGQLWQTNQRNQ